MPVDISSYPQAQPAVPLMQTLGQVAQTAGALNQNKLFQQQFNSNVALSQAAKAATDDQGNFDPAKYRAMIAQGPAGYMLPQAVEQSQAIQQGQIGINQSQYNYNKDKLSTLYGYAAPLTKPGTTSKDVVAALSHAMSAGIATPQDASALFGTLPRDQNGTIIESQIPQWATSNLLAIQDHAKQLDATNPSPSMQSLPGGGMAPFVMPQIGKVSQVGPTIGAAAPPTTQLFDPSGKSRYLGPTNANNPYAPNGQPIDPNATPQQPQQQSALTGSMPGLAPAGNQPPNASSAQGNGNIAGALAAPPPGVVDAAQVQAHASAQQGVALQQRSDAVPQTKALLGNLESEIDNFTPGPGANWSKTAGAFVNRLSQAVGLPGIDPKSISSQEQFNKQAAMIAQTQFQSLGGTGTDKQLGSTELTSPSSELSKLGNKGIISMLKGNEDAIATKNREWQQYQQANGPQSYGQFSTQFNKEYDPRVFQSVYLAPQDRSKMIAGMSKSEKDQFKQSYNLAVQKGWIPDPRKPNASQ